MENVKNHRPWRSSRPDKTRGIAGVGYVMPPQQPLSDEEHADLMTRLDKINNEKKQNDTNEKN